MAIETEVSAIASVHNIGALSLETLPLKTSLKAEAASWKAQFAHNLHKQGSEDLKAFDAYIRWAAAAVVLFPGVPLDVSWRTACCRSVMHPRSPR